LEQALDAVISRRPPVRVLALEPESYDIPLTTVSRDTLFDSFAFINLRGLASKPMKLLVDTGNSVLILPSWQAIAELPNWNALYTVLVDDTNEPWNAPAKLVKGPIEIAAADGSVFCIDDCIFYACTGNAPGENEPTANFGAGCLTAYDNLNGWPLRPAQTFRPEYPFAEFNFAPAASVLSYTQTLRVQATSCLRISKSSPLGYSVFDIAPNEPWMALIPKALTIGTVHTKWPSPARRAIAMIDTGGTCAYLSDPDDCVYSTAWPDPAPNPSWTSTSIGCFSTGEPITLTLGDQSTDFTYTIDKGAWPSTVKGLTLVMCEKNAFMWDRYGLNIGGISALSIGILVNYRDAQVGLRLK
jgi:hypothetical protein